MSRPGKEGGCGPKSSVAPNVKFALLQIFLTVEALKGNDTALRLLRDLRGKPRTVGA